MADSGGAVQQDGKKHHEFVKAIGLFDGTMIVVGSMIGSGIFIVASEISRQTFAWCIVLIFFFLEYRYKIGIMGPSFCP